MSGEQWQCLSCKAIGELDIHGRCNSCQSEAVVSMEAKNGVHKKPEKSNGEM